MSRYTREVEIGGKEVGEDDVSFRGFNLLVLATTMVVEQGLKL